jgi:hypothetical protein
MIFTSTFITYFIMYIIYVILINNIVFVGLFTIKKTIKYIVISTTNIFYIICNKIYDYNFMNRYKNKVNITENNEYLMVNEGPTGN